MGNESDWQPISTAAAPAAQSAGSWAPIGQASTPAPTPTTLPGEVAPSPSGPSLANVGANLAKIPGEVSDLASKIPGAQLGKAVGTSISKIGKGDFAGAASTATAGAKETNASIGPVVGDTIQAAALPASLMAGPADALGRIGVNAASGAALAGGNAAASGASLPKTIGTAAGGAILGGALSGAVEAAPLLKGTITGSTEPYSAALKDVTPEYETATPTQKAKLIAQHTAATPRIQEGGLVTGRTAIANETEKASATELAKVPGYSPNATALQKHTLVQAEIGSQADALRTSLRNENILVPPQELSNIVAKAATDVPDESTLIARGDAPLANYLRAAKASVAKAPGTLEGVLDVRQDLDAAYENARGKLAYGSDKIAPLDEIHQQARDALNQYLEDHAQNTQVKAALRSQSLLFRADDVLREKAANEGGSVLDRVKTSVKSHPYVSAGVGGAVTALGADKILKSVTGVGL
jgi:hypothetical protein